MRQPLRIAAFLLACLTILAACRGGDDGTAPEPVEEAATAAPTEVADLETAPMPSMTVEACELLTAADIDAELGLTVSQAEGSGGGTCSYTAQAPLSVITLVAQPDALVNNSFDDTMAAAAGLSDVTELADSAAVREVDDIGDGAFALEVAGVPMLYVAHGQHLIAVSVMAELDPEETLAAEKSLAAIALSRWP